MTSSAMYNHFKHHFVHNGDNIYFYIEEIDTELGTIFCRRVLFNTSYKRDCGSRLCSICIGELTMMNIRNCCFVLACKNYQDDLTALMNGKEPPYRK